MTECPRPLWRSEERRENLGSEPQALSQHHHSSLVLLSLALALVSNPIQVHFVLNTGLLPWVPRQEFMPFIPLSPLQIAETPPCLYYAQITSKP